MRRGSWADRTVIAAALVLVIAACGSDQVGREGVPIPQASAVSASVSPPPVATAAEPSLAVPPPVAVTSQPEVVLPALPPPPVVPPPSPPNPDMPLEVMVGQVFNVAVFGDHATEPSAAARSANLGAYGVATPVEVVQHYHLGGVTYFTNGGPETTNIGSPAEVQALSQALQAASLAANGSGLLISVDQEGGRVARLSAPATVMPAAEVFGQIGDPELAMRAAQIVATELRAVGITWSFAPVADVNSNPGNEVIGDRAFGADPGLVASMVTATLQGLGSAQVAGAVKHFPGHGDTTVDSHDSLPTIHHDSETLAAVDLPPFVAGIQTGASAVMVGHLAVPALDPTGVPATLSTPIVTGVLRRQLGFRGLVVTDGLSMGALSGFGNAGEISVAALRAGVDVLLLPTDLPAAYEAVLAAARDGTLPLDRLSEAVARVMALKAMVGVTTPAPLDPAAVALVGAPEHRQFRADLGARCGC